MKKLAIIYHSGEGHTEFLAQQIARAAIETGRVEVSLLKATELTTQIERLCEFDGLIFGSPTYFGNVSAPFKAMLDASGKLFGRQALRGKLAAGFTVSSIAAGDKQSTIQALFTYSMQQGMIWVGNPIMSEQHQGKPYEEAANRLGSWSGLMAQSEHHGAADAFASGDIRSAHLFAQNFVTSLLRFD